MKKLFTLFAMIMLSVFMVTNIVFTETAYAAKKTDSSVSVSVNGETLSEKGIVKNGRTFLPVSVIGKKLDLPIEWNQSTKTAVIKGSSTVEVKIGSKQALVNGEVVTLDVPAFVSGGRTMLPVSFIAKHLGIGISYDAKAKMVSISADGMQSAPQPQNPGQLEPQHPTQPEQQQPQQPQKPQQPKGKLKVVVDGTELKSVTVKNGTTYVSAKEFAAATGWLEAANTPDSLVVYWVDENNPRISIRVEFTNGKKQALYTGNVLIDVKSPSVGKQDGLVAVSDLVRFLKLDNRIESGVWVIDSQDHGKVWGIARGYSPQELEAWFNDPSDKFLEERE